LEGYDGYVFGCPTYNWHIAQLEITAIISIPQANSGWFMRYKICGTVVALIGIFLTAKYDLHLIGLILIFSGIFLAMLKGMKPE